MTIKTKKEPIKVSEKSFKKMHENGVDKLPIIDIFNDENLAERN